MKKLFMYLAVATLTLFTACTADNDNPVVVTDDKPFIYDSEIDYSVNPGDDFYRYALGQWLNSSNPSPSLSKDTKSRLAVIENSMLTNSSVPVVAQLRSQADETMTDDSKNKSLLNERLQMLEQVKTANQLYDAFKTLYDLGYSPIVRLIPYFAIGRRIINVIVTGGMPREMVYAIQNKNEKKVVSLVNKYCQHLSAFGFSDERIAQIVSNATSLELFEMEAYDASLEYLPPQQEVSKTRVTDDEPYQKLSRIMAVLGVTNEDYTNQYVTYNNRELYDIFYQFAFAGDDQNEIDAFRDYMIYNVMAQDAEFVPSVNKEATRLDMLKSALQYNRYYQYRLNTEYYGYDNIYKQQCTDIMERMRQMFIQRLEKLDWMSDATKAEARKKAEAMEFFIGYPDKWNDDLTPSINGDCLLASATQLRQTAVAQISAMRRKNFYESGWDVFLNSYYLNDANSYAIPQINSLLILPAWIMKPRFDINLSDACLYAVSTAFGHEFCHGFDSIGSNYDENGNRSDWWTPADKTAFQAKQQQMIELFNQLEVIPGLYADGTKTLSENMADYGGVELALACYKQLLKEQGFKGVQFDEQIKKFFLSYAQLWKDENELYEKALIYYYHNDTHSADHNRINGMMRLQDDWYYLYNVKPTDKLYVAPADRVKIW